MKIAYTIAALFVSILLILFLYSVHQNPTSIPGYVVPSDDKCYSFLLLSTDNAITTELGRRLAAPSSSTTIPLDPSLSPTVHADIQYCAVVLRKNPIILEYNK